MPALVHAPDGAGQKIAAIIAGHFGPPDRRRAAARCRSRCSATPLMDALGPMPYPDLNTLLDAVPEGARNYWKSAFYGTHDEAIDALVERLRRCPRS